MPVWFAWMTAWFTTTGLSAMFTVIGFVTNNPGFAILGATIGLPVWVFVIGTIVNIVCALATISGMRRGLNLMWVTSIIAVIGVSVGVLLLATSSHSAYVASFDKIASSSAVLSGAYDSGFPQIAAWNDFGASVKMMPLIALVITWPMLSVYVASELKDVKRNIPISVLGALIIGTITLAIMGWTISSTVGNDLMGAIGWTDFANPAAYPFPVVPSYFLVSSVLADSVPLLLLMGIATAMMSVANLLYEYLITPRMLLAWAFDRVLPKKMAHVSPRFHTPTPAILLTFIFAEFFLLVYVFFPTVVPFFAAMMLVYTACFGILGLSAIVFPFRRKDLYKGSPADIKIVGIPLMVIVGVGTIIFMVFLAYNLISDPAYLINSTEGLLGVAASWIIGIILWIIIWAVRKKQRIALGLAYKEIPPD